MNRPSEGGRASRAFSRIDSTHVVTGLSPVSVASGIVPAEEAGQSPQVPGQGRRPRRLRHNGRQP